MRHHHGKTDKARRLGLTIAALGLAGLAIPALADSTSSVSVSDLQNAVTSTDSASSFFRFLLGDFWDSPLTSVSSSNTGLFGAMFTVYNAVIFVVGVMWASYGIGSAILDTAQSGEALGKRISTVWLPIRMVTGIAGIVPVFGGFSLSQVVLVLMATLGIGAANLMTTAAINATSSYSTLMSPSAAVATSSKVDFKAAAASIFASYVCQMSAQQSAEDVSQAASTLAGDTVKVIIETLQGRDAGLESDDTVEIHKFGTTNNPLQCGGYTLEYKGSSSSSTSNNLYSFQTSAVNYDTFTSTLRTAAEQSTADALITLDAAVQTIATTWYQNRHGATDSTSVPYPQADLQAAVDTAIATRSSELQSQVDSVISNADGSSGTISTAVQTQMKSQGFAAVGAWYSTFAEASAAFSNALDSVKLTTIPVSKVATWMDSSLSEDMSSVAKAANESAVAGTQSQGDGAFMSWLCRKVIPAYGSTVTGDCSLGQALVTSAIHGATYTSGGSNLVNPIMMFKNFGDLVLNVADVMSATIIAAKVAGLDQKQDGVAMSVVKNIPVVGGVVSGVTQAIASAVGSLVWMLPYIVVVGLLMSIYIPMIPFITWMGGLTQYVVIFCQGIVGMPIAAFAHLDSHGEGMGQRTEAGYMFMLNVMFRPALMLFGFFMASGLMIILGTFQASLFITAMANAQGNSTTGLFSILGYLALFASINIMLVQSLFNMIHLLPDQILSLVGSGGHMADLGKEAEGKIHALFTSVGRSSQAMMGAAGGKKKPPPKPPGGGGKPEDSPT